MTCINLYSCLEIPEYVGMLRRMVLCVKNPIAQGEKCRSPHFLEVERDAEIWTSCEMVFLAAVCNVNWFAKMERCGDNAQKGTLASQVLEEHTCHLS